MKHVNRPDPKRPPDLQDKRMVTVILPDGLYETWVDAPAANSEDFIRQHPANRLLATAEPLAPKTMRPTPAPSVQGELL